MAREQREKLPRPTVETMLYWLADAVNLLYENDDDSRIRAGVIEYLQENRIPADPKKFGDYLKGEIKRPSFAREFLRSHDLSVIRDFVERVNTHIQQHGTEDGSAGDIWYAVHEELALMERSTL